MQTVPMSDIHPWCISAMVLILHIYCILSTPGKVPLTKYFGTNIYIDMVRARLDVDSIVQIYNACS